MFFSNSDITVNIETTKRESSYESSVSLFLFKARIEGERKRCGESGLKMALDARNRHCLFEIQTREILFLSKR